MAREPSITFEQVAAAADNIKAQSQKPTARNVREALGAGSMATVLKFLQQWQGGQVRQSQAIDDTLDVSIVRAISNQIATKVQEATADTTAQLADLQSETDTLITENERQAAELENKAVELAALQEQHSALAGRTEQLEDENERQAAALLAERQASEGARVELAKAELRLEAVPRIEAEIEKVRLELDEERKKSSSLHEAAAVANAKLESETSLKLSLLEQLLKVTKSAEENADRAIKATEQLSNEKVLSQTLQARTEVLSRELATANDVAKKAGEMAAELKGQLAATEKKYQ
ncbi:MAG: DNA-binding protein [Burkholderiaceae bacterium]